MTIQLIGNIEENEYMGFGFSEKGSSKMVGSDVAIAYIDGLLGYVDDYNITAKSPCSGILGVKKGVCLDEHAHTGGTNDNQIQTFTKENGLTKVTFRKTLGTQSDQGNAFVKDFQDRSALRAPRFFIGPFEPTYLRNPLFDSKNFLHGLSLAIYLKDSQVWLNSG